MSTLEEYRTMSKTKQRTSSSTSTNLTPQGSRVKTSVRSKKASMIPYNLTSSVLERAVDYQCTGNFKEDFYVLCLQKKTSLIPSVVPRPIPPGVQLTQEATIVPTGKTDKKLARRNTRGKSKHGDVKVGKPRLPRTPSRMREGEELDTRVESAPSLPLLSDVCKTGVSAMSSPLPSEKITDINTEKRPSTFSTKDKLDYFKPTIQVEQENMEDGKTVQEIYIRGWKVDLALMEVLERCLPAMPMLRLLHLWNVGLDVETLTLLASFLPQCSNLTTLVLDGNTLTGYPVSKLLGPTCYLEYLSLRFCGLTEIEAGGIGGQLRSTTLPLQTLLLTGNHIGDVGATYIADALRLNRTLLTLNLSANGIKDEGAASLSVALSHFQLSHQQLVERRQLLSKKLEREKENMVPAHLIQRQSRSKSSLGYPKDIRAVKENYRKVKDTKAKLKVEATSVRQQKVSKHGIINFHLDTKKGHQDTQKLLRTRRNSPASRCSSEFLDKLDKKVSESLFKIKSARRRKKSRSDVMCVNVEKEEDDLSPLTQDVENRDGQLWLVANRTLMSLNLMRNKMSERGLKLLLAAVEAQVISNVVTNVRRQREDHATGLYRLEVLRNAVSDNCPAATELRRLMRSRDPLLRSPRMDLEKLIVAPCAIPIML